MIHVICLNNTILMAENLISTLLPNARPHCILVCGLLFQRGKIANNLSVGENISANEF